MRVLGVLATTLIGLAGMVGAGFWAARHGAEGSWVVGPISLTMATAALGLGLTWSLPGDPRHDPRWRRRWRLTLWGCSVGAIGNAIWLGALLSAQGAPGLLALLGAAAVLGYAALSLFIGEHLRHAETRSTQH